MVFNRETEKKIVETIKKSPIGLSSGEIAKTIGLNRMTITKYLAIIREKALIDFKQFGMAKLWYIPVKISKEYFLSKILVILSSNLEKKQLKSVAEKTGIELGQDINRMYLDFYDTEKLTAAQLSDAFGDIGKKLGGTFKATLATEKISVDIPEHPFGESKEVMNIVLSAVFAKMAALNIGSEKTLIQNKEDRVVIEVFLKS